MNAGDDPTLPGRGINFSDIINTIANTFEKKISLSQFNNLVRNLLIIMCEHDNGILRSPNIISIGRTIGN